MSVSISNCTAFARGTTPVITLNVSPPEILDGATIHLCIKQGQLPPVTKRTEELNIDLANGVISVKLSQLETLRFFPGAACVQIRGVDPAGTAWATDMEPIDVLPVLEGGVIEYGG